MAIVFSAHPRPGGFRLACAFEDETFGDLASAVEAAIRHGQDGCGPARDFAARTPPAARLQAREAFAVAHPRRLAPDRCIIGVDVEPVYLEAPRSVRVPDGLGGAIAAVLGFGREPLAPGLAQAEDLLGRILLARALGHRAAEVPAVAAVCDDLERLAGWARDRQVEVGWTLEPGPSARSDVGPG